MSWGVGASRLRSDTRAADGSSCPNRAGTAGSITLPHKASQWHVEWEGVPQQSACWPMFLAASDGMVWSIAMAVMPCAWRMSCAPPAIALAAGRDTAISHHASSAAARNQCEAAMRRRESGQDMAHELSPGALQGSIARRRYFTTLAWL